MIGNKSVIYLTLLVLLSMGILFFMNIDEIVSGKIGNESFIAYNDVSGMAVKHQGLVYTLNFKQQTDALDILNRSLRIKIIDSGERSPPDIEQIIIYRFGTKPPLLLTPVTYLNDNLVYTNSEWNPDGYLKEVSRGVLKQILSDTYDR